MIRCDILRGKIAEKGFSQSRFAKELGITPKTFYTKMEKGVFNSNEILAMIDLLDIDNPTDVFFAKEVAQQATYENN